MLLNLGLIKMALLPGQYQHKPVNGHFHNIFFTDWGLSKAVVIACQSLSQSIYTHLAVLPNRLEHLNAQYGVSL